MCKLLVIDDNPIERLIIERMLANSGIFHNRVFYTEGKAALNMLKSNHNNPAILPDVILLDLSMPDYTGWNFLEDYALFYKMMVKKPYIYILSSSVSKADMELPTKYSFIDAYINKPIHKQQLMDIFDTCEESAIYK